MRIVIAEYPKSGGSWVTSMLGDALQLPKRDIYVSDGYNAFDVTKHPWYEQAQSLNLTSECVIKSHELPDSPMITFPIHVIHLVRDGRDVVISKYFFERDFCVTNGIYDQFAQSFVEYLPRVAAEWRNFVLAWMNKGVPFFKYEDFLRDPGGTLKQTIRELRLDVPETRVQQAVEANTKDRFKRSLDKTFKYNTFVRKAIAGDWRNHFSAQDIEVFKEIAGDLLIQLDYEQDLSW